MNTTVTTRARSPLGTLLALALVATLLVFAGLHLLTDGNFLTKLRESLGNPAAGASTFQSLQNALKQYDRPQLLTAYAFMIVAGAAAVRFLSSFIRTNQYRFSRQHVEKRGLFLYLPLCVVAWFALTAVFMFVDKWLVLAMLRGTLPQTLFDRFAGYIAPILWLAVSGGLAFLLLWIPWKRLAPYLGRSLFLPGFPRRVPITRVKRMEIQNSGEGATALVLVLHNDQTWTLQAGRPKRLQRLGAVLSRRLGLERRDFLTWA